MGHDEVADLESIRRDFATQLRNVTPELVEQVDSLDDARELIRPLARATGRAWSQANPEFDRDAFQSVSNLWVERGPEVFPFAVEETLGSHPESIREMLVCLALAWQSRFGVAPSITSAISELDAARLVCMSDDDYSEDCTERTAVTPGIDFTHEGVRYQVKANRPSGKPGSPVTWVPQAKPSKKTGTYAWDYLIWILYDVQYRAVEAWQWSASDYERVILPLNRVSPEHMRSGTSLDVRPLLYGGDSWKCPFDGTKRD